MREILPFACEGETLLATLDGPRDATTGWLFVTGGTQTRVGPHRLYERLADALAEAGQAVLRFDRRGVGDSGGADPGYDGSAPDLAAALALLKARVPTLDRLLGFGLCDGATALALNREPLGLDMLALANPWAVEPRDDLPPAAAIRGHYRRKIADPKAWGALLRGRINLGRLARGLLRSAWTEQSALAHRLAGGIRPRDTIILARDDGTAQAFRAACGKVDARWQTIATASHSFADGPAFAELRDALLAIGSTPPR
ncbi:MAG TPA: hydrolase 1, exosortase A system-associated [Sphingomonas sp.]|nr:hydrolase 1, exosortase A system-associated [Sphingomonas sp.]